MLINTRSYVHPALAASCPGVQCVINALGAMDYKIIAQQTGVGPARKYAKEMDPTQRKKQKRTTKNKSKKWKCGAYYIKTDEAYERSGQVLGLQQAQLTAVSSTHTHTHNIDSICVIISAVAATRPLKYATLTAFIYFYCYCILGRRFDMCGHIRACFTPALRPQATPQPPCRWMLQQLHFICSINLSRVDLSREIHRYTSI